MSEVTQMTRGENITETTRLRVGYIGIGNAGCQIGIKIVSRVPVYLVNTSFKDLNDGIVPPGIPSYLIEDPNGKSRGAGRNRDIAKALFDRSAIMKEQTFTEFVQDKDILIIGASTAGGTGSGITPTMIFQLSQRYPSKNISAVFVIPRENESVNCQYNTAEAMTEISQVGVPYQCYDLNKGNNSLDEIYKQIAAQIADNVGLIAGEMSTLTEHGMIDERDLLTILTEPGLTTIVRKSGIDLNKLPEGGLQQVIVDTIKKTYVADPQKDKIVKYYGLFLEVPEEAVDDIKQSNYQILKDFLGTPWDIFINFTVVDKSTASFGFIASGMSYPMDRLSYCTKIAEEYSSTRKSRIYNQSEEVDKLSHLAENANVDKLLHSSNSTPVKTTEEVKKSMPDFLKPRNKV